MEGEGEPDGGDDGIIFGGLALRFTDTATHTPSYPLIQVSALSPPIAIVEIQYAIVPLVLEIFKIEKFRCF